MDVPQTHQITQAMEDERIGLRPLGVGRHRNPSYNSVVSLENLFGAWNEFLRGKRSRNDVQEYGRHYESRLFDLHDRLVKGTWIPGPYEEFCVCDPKLRMIHKASVEDRIVHHAVVRVVEPMFDASFIFDSWSCRRGKGTHAAVKRLQSELRRLSQQSRGTIWILKADIRKFFQSIDQGVLLRLIQQKLEDARLLTLIQRILVSRAKGLPLGNLTSQLFANVYLNPFDHFLKEQLRAEVYLRYSDDFVIASKDRAWLEDQILVIASFLKTVLVLDLHPQKMFIRPWHWGIDWLGYVVYPDRVIMRGISKRRMCNRLDAAVSGYLNKEVGEQTIRSVFASYDGVLHSTNEGDLRKFYRTLCRCLI